MAGVPVGVAARRHLLTRCLSVVPAMPRSLWVEASLPHARLWPAARSDRRVNGRTEESSSSSEDRRSRRTPDRSLACGRRGPVSEPVREPPVGEDVRAPGLLGDDSAALGFE